MVAAAMTVPYLSVSGTASISAEYISPTYCSGLLIVVYVTWQIPRCLRATPDVIRLALLGYIIAPGR